MVFSLFAVTSIMGALAFAAPALADTNPPTASVSGSVAAHARFPVIGGLNDRWKGGMNGMPSAFGVVSAINGTSITLTRQAGPNGTPAAATYTVDASSATVTKGRATAALSDIAVGDRLMVRGTVNGTNITATSIMDIPAGSVPATGAGFMRGDNGRPASVGSLPQGNGEPVIGGTIASVLGTTFTLTNSGSATYSVDASSATIKKGSATSTASDLAVGDHVIVQGAVNGSSVTASTVLDQGAPSSASSASGASASANVSGNGRGLGGFLGGLGNFIKHLFGF